MTVQKNDIKTLKDIQKAELLRCAQEPVYFMKKYVFIQTSKGRALFIPYLFQEKLLFNINKFDKTIIVKSRQMGITTICAAYALWLMIFRKDTVILALAPTQEKAKNIVDKLRFAYDELPSWLKVEALEKTKLSITFKNGSKIKAASGASDSARGYTANVLIVDEAAFIENVEELWGAAQQTMATGNAKAIVLSTPYGIGNWFHKMCEEAENGENNFTPMRLPWNYHPDRDQRWRDQQDKELGNKKMAAQECDCTFLASGDGYFDSEDLEFFATNIEDPIQVSGADNGLWTWEHADPMKNYMCVVDTSRGDGNDYSAIQVLEIFTGNQVAEYKGNIDTKALSRFAVSLALQYNNALLIIENTGIGQTTVSDVTEIGYSNIYYSPKGQTTDVNQYLKKYFENDPSKMTAGFTTSTKTRPLILHAFRQYVLEKNIKIRSRRTVSEMRTFIWKNGKPQAQNGYNDDLIMPYAIGMFLRDSAIEFRSQGIEMQRAVLQGIKTQTPLASLSRQPNNFQNPYKININGQEEDISWLIR